MARGSASLRSLYLAVFIVLFASHLSASDFWLVRNQNFELYSSLTAERTASVLAHLTEANHSLDQLALTQLITTSSPVRVIALSSEGEFVPYRSNEAATAFYLHFRGRDYIVLGGEATGSTEALVHEYVHYAMHRRFRNLPLWLDEGLAEVYSTIDEKQGQLRIGLPSTSRLDWLRTDKFSYDLQQLFQMRSSSFDDVKHLAPRSRFYAESWLLVHMLSFSPEYQPRFREFLLAVATGTDVGHAFESVYCKSLDNVQSDLSRYRTFTRMPTRLVSAASSADASFSVAPKNVSASEFKAVLDDLRVATNRAH
jgi:hypothetical protein